MAVNIITQFVLKQFAKRSARKTGIASLKKASDSIVRSNVRNIEIILKNMGIDPKSLKSTDDVLKHMNYHQAMMNQRMNWKFEHMGLGKGVDDLEKATKKTPFQGMTPRIQQDVDSIIKDLKNMEPVAAMKEANLIIGRKGKYKNLSGDESQRILKETDDHIFQRDIQYDEFGDPIKPDPEDMASGGTARAGYFAAGPVGKGLVKGGKWFLKSLYDTKKQLMQLDIPLSQKKELMKQADDAIKHIEGGGPIPEQIIQHIRKDPKFKSVHQTRSADPDLAEMEEVILEYGKRHAEGGRASLMYGGDPGFAFEYGGSWADWHDQHRDQMPVEQYIKTKLPKHRLPFREMEEGGIARVKFNQGKEGELFGIPMEDIKKYQEKKRRGEIMDRTSPLAIPDDWLERLLRKFRRTETYEQSMQEGGLAYMLGEPTYMKYGAGGSVGHAPWHKPTGQAQPTPHMDTPTPNVATRPDPLKAPRGIPSLAPKNMDPAYMQQQMMQQAMMGREPGTTGQGPRPMAAEGGLMRMGFKKGGDMSRRGFMKLIAGLAALPVFGKYFKAAKLAKPAAAVTETIIKSNAPGMPAWFPSLVRRVLKEGKDETAKLGTIERQTVHTAKTPEGTPIQVTRDLTTDDIIVDIGEQTKHGWSAGRHGQPTRLELKKGEWIEPTKKGKKGIKTKDEFFVEEAEFTGGHPENIKFEDVSVERYGDHASDFTEIEKYAVGKNIDKKIVGKKAKSDADAEMYAESRAEGQLDDIDPDDFAKGGLAYLLGE